MLPASDAAAPDVRAATKIYAALGKPDATHWFAPKARC